MFQIFESALVEKRYLTVCFCLFKKCLHVSVAFT